MTRRVLCVLTLLGGCCAAPIPPPPVIIPPVPPELRTCPPTPVAVPIPKPPRTWDTVVGWGNASDARRDETAHALEVCRARLVALLRWIEDRKAGRDGEHASLEVNAAPKVTP